LRLRTWQRTVKLLQQLGAIQINHIGVLLNKCPHVKVPRQLIEVLIFNGNQITLLNLRRLLQVI